MQARGESAAPMPMFGPSLEESAVTPMPTCGKGAAAPLIRCDDTLRVCIFQYLLLICKAAIRNKGPPQLDVLKESWKSARRPEGSAMKQMSPDFISFMNFGHFPDDCRGYDS